MKVEEKPSNKAEQPNVDLAIGAENWRVPQIEALKQAIAAADQGKFASVEELEAFFKRYR